MEKKEGEWLYYEQDGFEITLASYQNGKMAMEAISELSCFICIPDDEPETEWNMLCRKTRPFQINNY